MLINLKKIGASSPEGKTLLVKSKDSLIAHLKKEDDQLYPPLVERAKVDSNLKSTLVESGKEMEGITKFVIGFYDKYTADASNTTAFLDDLDTFLTTLKSRIVKEETGIYKAYEYIKESENE